MVKLTLLLLKGNIFPKGLFLHIFLEHIFFKPYKNIELGNLGQNAIYKIESTSYKQYHDTINIQLIHLWTQYYPVLYCLSSELNWNIIAVPSFEVRRFYFMLSVSLSGLLLLLLGYCYY